MEKSSSSDRATLAGDRAFSVVRFNTDGSLDTSFDTDGIATTQITTDDDRAEGVAIQPDGKIVLDGYADNGTDLDIAVVRFLTIYHLLGDPALELR